ncbi:MAG: sigma-70 family RNA polymerase sigma factor [Planctomycetota bacterium]
MTAITATASQPSCDPLGAERWVDDHGDALLRFALSRGLELAEAEDAVQETLLAAWRSRDRFHGECSVRTWLVAILKRRVADHYRRGLAKRRASEPLEPERLPPANCPPPDSAVTGEEFWSILTGCTRRLPEHLGRAFALRSLSEVPIDSICEQEGVTRENLSVRLCRARTLLRRCLERHWFREP